MTSYAVRFIHEVFASCFYVLYCQLTGRTLECENSLFCMWVSLILKGQVKFNQGKYWIFSDILAWLTSLKNTYYRTLPQEESYQILQKQQITVVSTVQSVFPFPSVTIHVQTLVPMVHNVISLTGIVVALLDRYWNHEKRKKNVLLL